MTNSNNNDLSPHYSEEISQPIDEKRRRFLLNSLRVLGGVGALCALTPFITSWCPTDKIKTAGGAVRVDVSHLKPGQQITVAWRGKPVWIVRRTRAMLEQLQHERDVLRDPDSRVHQQPIYAKNTFRSINPEYIVLIGLCTHLGCSPNYKPNGDSATNSPSSCFICPCHGSRFDMAGRVYKGVPAPVNLEVPPYHFIQEHVLEIGES